jgi:hypothetical protein
MGYQAGYQNQAISAVAIGPNAGRNGQQGNAIAIGNNAGAVNQGFSSIAIGYQAAPANQSGNSIVINATNIAVNTTTTSACYVAPIRGPISTSTSLYYDAGTKEITYGAKFFIIDHPLKPESHHLVHACLEGPEAGVYYRGEETITDNESTEIVLPDYVEALATNFTIQITPIRSQGSEGKIYETSEVENNAFQVYGPNGSFFWEVYGERGPVLIEPRKDQIQVSGDGPYKYISGIKK